MRVSVGVHTETPWVFYVHVGSEAAPPPCEPCPTKYTHTGPLRLRVSLAEPWRLPCKRKAESLGDSLQPGEQRQVGAKIPSGAREQK